MSVTTEVRERIRDKLGCQGIDFKNLTNIFRIQSFETLFKRTSLLYYTPLS